MVDLLSPWVAAGLTALAAMMGAITLAGVWAALRDWRQRRAVLRNLQSLVIAPDDAGGRAGALFRDRDVGGRGWLERLRATAPRLDGLERWLRQADAPLDVPAFLLLTAGSALGLGLAALLIGAPAPFALAAAGTGAAGPSLVMHRRRARRFHRFEAELPEAIDLLSRAIRAGHPFSTGVRMVADETPEPVASEFRQVFEEQRFGLPLDESLLALVDRVPSTDVRMLTTAILIQREVGGNLAEILDKLAEVIRARFRFRRQLRVHTAQGRISGYILAALPIAVGGIFFVLNPSYVRTLFDAPLGRFLIASALMLQFLGYLWIRHIIRIEP